MLAERDESPAAVPVRVNITNTASQAPANRKRKQPAQGTVSASSPAPESFSLQISDGPVTPAFIPVKEGSIYHHLEHIVHNFNGFRYSPAGAAAAGSALLAKTVESNPRHYRVSWEDRSPSIKVTTDGLGLAGADGFRSARCNAPVREGKWYMEIKVELGGGDRSQESVRQQGAHVRLGWGRREAPLSGPAGMDGYSYGIRDKTGEKVNLSRPRPYGRSFSSGDVIGMYISLPPLRQPDKNDPFDPARVNRERIPIQLKDRTYFESKEYPISKEMQALMEQSDKGKDTAPLPAHTSGKKSAGAKSAPKRGPGVKATNTAPQLRPLPILEGSHIAFFVNGECQGVAFQDLYDYRPLRLDPTSEAAAKAKASRRRQTEAGAPQAHRDNPFDDGSLGYYPFISLFNDARVVLNPGPDFAFPPPADIDAVLAARENNGEAVMDVDADVKVRTWRPLCERYSEYFAEQFALDEVDEERAKITVAQQAKEAEQEEKAKAARDRKRAQAQARKKAKLDKNTPVPVETDGAGVNVPEATPADREGSMVALEDELCGLAQSSVAPSPAPDGHAPNLAQFDTGADLPNGTYSPAPSGVDVDGAQSGYQSEEADQHLEDTRGNSPARELASPAP